MTVRTSFATIAVLMLVSGSEVAPQTMASTERLRGNDRGHLDRAVRYRPDGDSFVIENGQERFNRPLYGGNTAFRVDGGDKPEFVLYLPGRGGNLRFAVRQGNGKRWWLHDAASITTRYRPGELEYVIRDPRLGGQLELVVVALAATEGIAIRAKGTGFAPGTELDWAYGGVNGERGVRDGDIGTERVPISQWFGFKPEFAQDNRVEFTSQGFTLAAKPAMLAGVVVGGTATGAANGEDWNDPNRLFAKRPGGPAPTRPIVTGVLTPGDRPAYLLIQRTAYAQDADTLATYAEVGGRAEAALPPLLPQVSAAEVPTAFAAARAHFAKLRASFSVTTPDPWLNAAVAALPVAADAVWDAPSGTIAHGAIAWRTSLLGWRGPYVLDALGWHDRARSNIDGWLPRQNVAPVPAKIPPADIESNLARNEKALHSNGDLSKSHYDMNAGFIDALFRHIDWTGDLALARRAWPVIERHLAWEKRLFRRPFGPTGLPLYEAYAQIWASDDVQYSGGGVAYASAYNIFHNREAAQIARMIGQDATPYNMEAAAIAEAMRTELWMAQEGRYAEYRDWLGERLLHPSAGLWSFYHVVDSQVPDTRNAWRMANALPRAMPFLPVTGSGVPTDRHYGVYSDTDWMPYTWSINNVVFAENLHTALGLWQAEHSRDAYTLMKSTLLASMYMGISPGNVGTLNYLDVYRREAQRDFADGSGVMGRLVVEGLFGVVPDALNRRIEVRPGLPAEWDYARLDHPDVGVDFRRLPDGDHWKITQARGRFKTVRLRLPAVLDRVAAVRVDGKPARWTPDADAVASPAIVIESPMGGTNEIVVRWSGDPLPAAPATGSSFVRRTQGSMQWWQPTGPVPKEASAPILVDAAPVGPQRPVDLSGAYNDGLSDIFAPGKYQSPRSPFASLALPSQGLGAWAGHVNATATIDDRGIRRLAAANAGWLKLPDGGKFRTPAVGPNVVFASQWDNYPREITIPLNGNGKFLRLLMAGTTNAMQSRLENGEVIVTYTDGGTATLSLYNPTTWWPIERDYLIDDYQFRSTGPRPLRVDLATGKVRRGAESAPAERLSERIAGGSATVLGISLDPNRPLRSMTIRARANDVVIGLLAATIEEPSK